MNLIKYLESYATTESAIARFFVILVHMPILMLVIAMHIVEALIRGVTDFLLGMTGAVGNAVFGTHTAIINGLRVVGGTVLKVAKGPAKVVKAVAAPTAELAASWIKDAENRLHKDMAEAEAVPGLVAQHMAAAARGFINGSPIPAKVAPVATTTVAGQAPVVHV